MRNARRKVRKGAGPGEHRASRGRYPGTVVSFLCGLNGRLRDSYRRRGRPLRSVMMGSCWSARRAALNTLMAGGVGTAVGGGAYGLAYSRHNIQVVRTAIPVSGLNPALDGLRIGLITDLHHSEMVPVQDVVRAASLMMAERPDLIVLGGDYVTWGDRSLRRAVF